MLPGFLFSWGESPERYGHQLTNDDDVFSLGPIADGLGDLLNVRLTVEPRGLENALEALSLADFPINPQLTHQRLTLIEFPAYRGQLKQLEDLLRGLVVEIAARSMIDEIRAPFLVQ